MQSNAVTADDAGRTRCPKLEAIERVLCSERAKFAKSTDEATPFRALVLMTCGSQIQTLCRQLAPHAVPLPAHPHELTAACLADRPGCDTFLSLGVDWCDDIVSSEEKDTGTCLAYRDFNLVLLACDALRLQQNPALRLLAAAHRVRLVRISFERATADRTPCELATHDAMVHALRGLRTRMLNTGGVRE